MRERERARERAQERKGAGGGSPGRLEASGTRWRRRRRWAPAFGRRRGARFQRTVRIGILEGAPRASAAPGPARSLARSRDPAGGSLGGRWGTQRIRHARGGPRLVPQSVPGGGRRLSKPPSKSVAVRVSEPGSRLVALPSPEKEAKSLLGIGKSFKSLLAESEFLLSSCHAPSGNFGPIRL